jgi:hypothetical protein
VCGGPGRLPIDFDTVNLVNGSSLDAGPDADAGSPAALSIVAESKGFVTRGFTCGPGTGEFAADDFTITDPLGITLERITLYAYQVEIGTTASTLGAVRYRIWRGPPGAAGSSIVTEGSGAPVANEFSGVYRVVDTALAARDRPIMRVEVAPDIVLPTGTYWVSWQVSGTDAGGPFCPPLQGSAADAGNALRGINDGGTWIPAIDNGWRMEYAIGIHGHENCTAPPVDAGLDAPKD